MTELKTSIQPPGIINNAMLMAALAQKKQERNAALLKQMSELEAKRKKDWLEANNFTLSVLSGVNSQEDLDRARRILMARYPDGAENIDRSIPKVYDKRGISLVTNALRTAADRIRLQEMNQPKAFSPGSDIYQGTKKIASVAPKPNFELFENKDGDQIYVKKGSTIPKGYKRVKSGGLSVEVNTGLGKSTLNDLQKQIIEGMRSIQSFRNTRKLFKPEYLTLWGKGKEVSSKTLDKLGLSTKEQKEFIRDRNKWFRQAKSDFLQYRRWATGVAGGEKEIKEIATAFPDPVRNSPEQYKANLDSIEETTKRILAMNQQILASGIDLTQPLEDIFEQMRRTGIDIPKPPNMDNTGNVTIIRYDENGNRI